MNNTATATAKETVRRPAPAAPSSAGKEDMNDKIRRLIKMGCEG